MAELGISVIATSTHEWIAHVRAAERAGLAGAWAADAFVHDAFVGAALALAVTETLPIGVAIAMPTRTPLQTAKAAANLASLGGRFTLGLGPGHSDKEIDNPFGELMLKVIGPFTNRRAHGIPYAPPVERMQDYHACIAGLLRAAEGEPFELRGEYFSIAGNGYGLAPADLPIVLGGIAPRMTRLAAEVAEGLVTHLLTPREIIAKRLAAVRELRSDAFFTAAGVECSIDRDERVALRRARAEVAGSLQIAHFVDRLRDVAGDELTERVLELMAKEKYDAAAEALPEEVVRSYILVTTPDRFAEDVAAYEEVDVFLPLPVGQFFLSLGGILGTGMADATAAREELISAVFGRALQPAA